MDRRMLLKNVALTAVGSCAVPSLLKGSVLPPTGPTPTPGHTIPKLSTAVVGAAHTAAYNSWLRFKARKETPLGLHGTATAFAILHAHMQEVGWNKAVTPIIITNLKNTIASGRDLSPALIALGHRATINLTNAEATNVFSGGRARLESVLTALQTTGLYGVHNAITTTMSTVAYDLQHEGIKTISGRIAMCGVEAAECGLLGIFSPPPVDIAMGIMAGIFGLMEAMGFCGE